MCELFVENCHNIVHTDILLKLLYLQCTHYFINVMECAHLYGFSSKCAHIVR
jgi:hypothetical protein